LRPGQAVGSSYKEANLKSGPVYTKGLKRYISSREKPEGERNRVFQVGGWENDLPARNRMNSQPQFRKKHPSDRQNLRGKSYEENSRIGKGRGPVSTARISVNTKHECDASLGRDAFSVGKTPRGGGFKYQEGLIRTGGRGFIKGDGDAKPTNCSTKRPTRGLANNRSL